MHSGGIDAAAVYAQAALQHGIETLSQAEVGSALQVYFNLGLLKQVCISSTVHVRDTACKMHTIMCSPICH